MTDAQRSRCVEQNRGPRAAKLCESCLDRRLTGLEPGKGVPVIRLLARILTLGLLWHLWKTRDERRPLTPTHTGHEPKNATVPGAPGTREFPRQSSGEADPDTPLALQTSDWKQTAKRALKEIKNDRVTLVAAGMAYYFFLAIFPALIALVAILGLANVDAAGLVESIRATLPGGAGRALTVAVANADNPGQAASLAAAIVGILIALFSASSGMVALQKGLNIAYDVNADRKFLPARGVALALLLATVLLGAVPSPFFTFGEAPVFQVVGWLLTVAAVMVLFSIYYFIGPKRESPAWAWVTPGGAFGAVLWIAVSLGFGFYVTNFNNYGKTYGPLAGVIVLILWLYLSSLAVLIGGELNAELENQAARR